MRNFNKKIIAITSLLAGVAASALDMPSISSPSMPELSSPSMSSNWYRPQFNGQGVVSNNTVKRSTAVSEPKKTTTTQLYGDMLSSSTDETFTNKDELVASLGKLSSADISQMGNLGLLSKLFDGKNIQEDSNASPALLNQILSELNQIKSDLHSQADKVKEPVVQTVEKSGLLRFNVNGSSIRESCKSVYISTPESDGTFLFTTDRSYALKTDEGSKANPETVYFLFTPAKSRPGLTQFNVEIDLTQSIVDENSPLYQIAKNSPLIAVRTGNLTSIKSNANDLQMDLLLDTGRR